MSFTDSQKLSIARILGITPTLLDAQITSLGASLTAAKETAVIAEIARWTDGAGTNFTRIHPKEKNFGAEINPESAKKDIRANIALILEWQSVIESGIGTIQISN